LVRGQQYYIDSIGFIKFAGEALTSAGKKLDGADFATIMIGKLRGSY
jgi:hypothetical protein